MTSELTAYSGEGIQRDLSFKQHRAAGKLNYYSGQYGMVFAHRTARIMRWTNGTPYAFGKARDRTRGAIHGRWPGLADAWRIVRYSFAREVHHEAGFDSRGTLLLRQTLMTWQLVGRRNDEILFAIDRYDNGVNDSNFLSGNIAFWSSDAMTNQRRELLTTVKMLSSRVARPETAAGENQQGYFLGDGFTMFVQDGNEFGSLPGRK